MPLGYLRHGKCWEIADVAAGLPNCWKGAENEIDSTAADELEVPCSKIAAREENSNGKHRPSPQRKHQPGIAN